MEWFPLLCAFFWKGCWLFSFDADCFWFDSFRFGQDDGQEIVFEIGFPLVCLDIYG
jgi:hypothetical protein